jgi:hypothetical protein
MKEGPEKYVLTDEGDINKFLGIEIKEITRNKFELSQPFLINKPIGPTARKSVQGCLLYHL